MRRSLAALLLVAATTSGCSALDSVTARFGDDAEQGTPVVTIAVLAPLRGGQTRVGTSVVDAVQQAVDDSGGITGWDVVVSEVDLLSDTIDEQVADVRTDDSTVAAIAGFGADDVRTLVPQLDDAGLSVVSPADADPRHTRGADPAAPLRPWSSYVTVAVEPTPEQTALARHLVNVAKASRVLVVHADDANAEAAAEAVLTSLQQRGVVDAQAQPWGGGSADARTALADLQPGDALVVEGPATLAAAVAQERPDGVALALGSVPEALDDTQSVDLEGAVAPVPGLDPRRGTDELAAAYEVAGTNGAITAVAPAAYDAGRLLMDAFSRCLPDPTTTSSPSRSACRAEVAGATWSGLTGPIQFDEFGARLGLLPTVVTLTDGGWS